MSQFIDAERKCCPPFSKETRFSLPSGQRSGQSYAGETAFAGSLNGRVSDGVYLSGGVAGDTGSGKVGVRGAVTFGL
ncbi:hypothetical protein [Sphingomicrobium lutaoense]|uniref:Trimeric autotransporter adhesin YadA-like head domain-containing protein n=1 Tax=Sphingomicrobium lutaoense TaxID=515949 RepID=A0A839Z6N2_9SPHN|nr:hypothetical protein [Sphingomicrobium lutaoense]MBB3764394.1 hypothetical protein [Sphingomicrobium lutaoense]